MRRTAPISENGAYSSATITVVNAEVTGEAVGEPESQVTL